MKRKTKTAVQKGRSTGPKVEPLPKLLPAKQLKQSDKALNKLKGQTFEVLEAAQKFKVISQETYEQAALAIANINIAEGLMTQEKNKILLPAAQIVKVEKARWKPIEQAAEQAKQIYSSKMIAYVKEREAEELKVQQQLESGKIKRQETALKKIDAIHVNKTVHVSGVSATMREIDELVIEDVTKIPRQYMVPDEKAIKEALKAGKKVAGCRMGKKKSLAIS